MQTLIERSCVLHLQRVNTATTQYSVTLEKIARSLQAYQQCPGCIKSIQYLDHILHGIIKGKVFVLILYECRHTLKIPYENLILKSRAVMSDAVRIIRNTQSEKWNFLKIPFSKTTFLRREYQQLQCFLPSKFLQS